MIVIPKDLDMTEDELQERLVNDVYLFPFVEEAENLFNYDSLKTGETSYYTSNDISELGDEVVAFYTVFPTFKSVMDYLKRGQEAQENPEAVFTTDDGDIFLFEIQEKDGKLVAEAEFFGKLKDSSDEQKFEMIDQFINGLDRAARLLKMRRGEKIE